MLQKYTSDNRKKQAGPFNKGLQEAVKKLYELGIIKAQVDIVDRTGYGKSTVSEYVNGNKEASPDFIDEFEKVFDLKISRNTPAKNSNTLAQSARVYSIDDYINKIEEHNLFLQKVIEAGLVDIKQSLEINFPKMHESQDSAIIYQKAWIEKVARDQGEEDEGQVQGVRDEMDTIISEQRRKRQNENNKDESI
jgi:hypothetical protein